MAALGASIGSLSTRRSGTPEERSGSEGREIGASARARQPQFLPRPPDAVHRTGTRGARGHACDGSLPALDATPTRMPGLGARSQSACRTRAAAAYLGGPLPARTLMGLADKPPERAGAVSHLRARDARRPECRTFDT